uniref:Uncharacterized protein n=1 Tax=Ananas comosus var. bracteatus TaxID=296719 RepID=A0A6V7NWU4_ANACO|nr:unnamed protein product [Ananas comosus var. bracteatus]
MRQPDDKSKYTQSDAAILVRRSQALPVTEQTLRAYSCVTDDLSGYVHPLKVATITVLPSSEVWEPRVARNSKPTQLSPISGLAGASLLRPATGGMEGCARAREGCREVRSTKLTSGGGWKRRWRRWNKASPHELGHGSRGCCGHGGGRAGWGRQRRVPRGCRGRRRRRATAAAARGSGPTAPSLARSPALGSGAQGAWRRRRPFQPGEGVPEAVMEAAGVDKGGCVAGWSYQVCSARADLGWLQDGRGGGGARRGGGGRPGMVAGAPGEAPERRATSGLPLTRDEERLKEREMERKKDNGSAAARAQPPAVGGLRLGRGSEVKVAGATRVRDLRTELAVLTDLVAQQAAAAQRQAEVAQRQEARMKHLEDLLLQQAAASRETQVPTQPAPIVDVAPRVQSPIPSSSRAAPATAPWEEVVAAPPVQIPAARPAFTTRR